VAGHTRADASGPNDNAQPNANQGQQPMNEEQELLPDRPPSAEAAGPQKPRRPRGFAAMDRKLVSEIARKGGKAAHSAGTAHEFTTEEARVAGRKGGRATHAKRRAARGEGEGPPDSERIESSPPREGGEG
jgi:general stress protein YciG